MTRDTRLALGVALGPAAFLADLLFSFVVAPGSHHRRDAAVLLAASGVALAVAAIGATIGWRALHAAPAPASSRVRFLAHAAVALGALAMLLVVGLAMPTLVLSPGGEP